MRSASLVAFAQSKLGRSATLGVAAGSFRMEGGRSIGAGTAAGGTTGGGETLAVSCSVDLAGAGDGTVETGEPGATFGRVGDCSVGAKVCGTAGLGTVSCPAGA